MSPAEAATTTYWNANSAAEVFRSYPYPGRVTGGSAENPEIAAGNYTNIQTMYRSGQSCVVQYSATAFAATASMSQVPQSWSRSRCRWYWFGGGGWHDLVDVQVHVLEAR